jgi:hypothetical protein
MTVIIAGCGGCQVLMLVARAGVFWYRLWMTRLLSLSSSSLPPPPPDTSGITVYVEKNKIKKGKKFQINEKII